MSAQTAQSARSFRNAFVALPKKVKIVEVGPRDGLQNEKEILDTGTHYSSIHCHCLIYSKAVFYGCVFV
mgnify:CR=1 FL=1